MESLVIPWEAYVSWNPNQITIEKWEKGTWIVFVIGKYEIPYNLDTLWAHKVLWARMNMVCGQTKDWLIQILVPEHILSAIVMHSIAAWWWLRPDIRICFPERKKLYIPVSWPWIATKQDELLQALIREVCGTREVVGVFDPIVALDYKKNADMYHVFDKRYWFFREWQMEKSDGFSAQVMEAKQGDVKWNQGMNSFPAEIDFNALQKNHFSARPMWRLDHWVKYTWVRLAHLFGLFNWITPENYFIVGPWNTPDSIRKSMRPLYKETANEHLYHTLYADFPGELAALASSLGLDWFHVVFILENMTHADRVAWLKQIYEQGLIIPKIWRNVLSM